MPILVRDILNRVAAVLNDNEPGREFTRWPVDELIYWLNDGASEVVVIRPAAGARTQVLSLQEGVYQTLPAEAIQLLDIARNIGSGGRPGCPVQRTDRRLLDETVPDWCQMEPADHIQYFTFDDRNPQAFYNYPPAQAGVEVEALIATPPPKVEAIDDTLDMDRAYIGPLVSYMLYRALAKDSEYANGVVAAAHQQAFMTGLGVHNEIAITASPKGPLHDAP